MARLEYKKFGGMHFIFYKSKILFTLGPHCITHIGPFLILFNIVIFSLHMVFYFIILRDHSILKRISSLIFIILQCSYIYCGIVDPGVLLPCLNIDLDNSGFCYKCGAASGGTHCSLCDVCIEGHDHHCGFIGKCVGKKNLNSFYVLLISAFTTIVMVAGTLGWTTWTLQKKPE